MLVLAGLTDVFRNLFYLLLVIAIGYGGYSYLNGGLTSLFYFFFGGAVVSFILWQIGKASLK